MKSVRGCKWRPGEGVGWPLLDWPLLTSWLGWRFFCSQRKELESFLVTFGVSKQMHERVFKSCVFYMFWQEGRSQRKARHVWYIIQVSPITNIIKSLVLVRMLFCGTQWNTIHFSMWTRRRLNMFGVWMLTFKDASLHFIMTRTLMFRSLWCVKNLSPPIQSPFPYFPVARFSMPTLYTGINMNGSCRKEKQTLVSFMQLKWLQCCITLLSMEMA